MLFVIVFMLGVRVPRAALPVATRSVNKCDYMYFVYSYNCRMMVSLILAGPMTSLLPLLEKKKKKEKDVYLGGFVTRL